MTTEELRVRITVDTSGVTRGAAEARRALNGINSATRSVTGSTNNINASFDDLRDSIDQIRNMQFGQMIANQLDRIRGHAQLARESVTNLFSRSYWRGALENVSSFADRMEVIRVESREAWGSFKAAASAALNAVHIKLVALIGVVVGLGAAIKNAFSTAKYIKELNTEAAKIGLSVSTYQEWAYVLDHVGIGVDKLSDFIKTLSDEQNAVREGSEDIIKAFESLGMAAEDVATMSQSKLFKETIKNLQKVENEVDRTAIAYKIFGEDAAELANVLRLTNAETSKLAENMYLLGGYATQGLVEKSSALSKAISSLKQAWTGLTNTLGELFMPIITQVVEWLTKAVVVVNLFLKTIFGLDITPASNGLGAAVGSMGSYTESVEGATGAVEKLKKVTMGFDELNIVGNPNASASGAGSGGGNTGTGTGTGSGELDTSNSAFLKAQEQIEAFQKKVEEFMEKWKVQIGLVAGALGALSLANILTHLGQAVGLGDKFLSVMSSIKNLATAAIIITLQYSLVNEYLDKYIDGEGFKNYLVGLFVAGLGTLLLWWKFGPTGLMLGLGVTAVAALSAVLDNGGITNVESLTVALTGLASAIGAVAVAWKSLGLGALLTKVGGEIGAFIALLKESGSLTGTLAAAFPGLATAIGKIGAALGTAGSAVASFAGSIGSALGLTGGAAIAAGAAIIVAAIAAIASAIYYVVENWEQVKATAIGFFETNIVPKLEKMKEAWDKITEAVGGLLDAFAGLGEAIWNALPEGLQEWLAGVWQGIKDVVKAIGEWFASIEWLEAIGTVFETIGGVIFHVLGSVVAGAFSSVITVIEGFVTTISGIVEIVAGVVEAVVRLFQGDFQGALEAVKQVGQGIYDVFAGLYTMVVKPIEEFVQGVIDWFVALWDELVGHSIVPDMINAIVDWFLSLPKKIFGPLEEFIQGILDYFSGLWDDLKAWFNSNVAPKFTKDYWKTKFNSIKEGASAKLDEVKKTLTDKWNGITTWFKNNVSSKFTTQYWTNKFNTIKDGAKAAFNGVISVVENAVNGIIRKINTLSWKIPDWVPVFGGDTFGFNMREIRIPRLATGGIATRSTIANIGEHGREAILPLENNTGWMDALAVRLAAILNPATKVVLKVNERELGYATINAINNNTKQTGGLQLQLV